MFILLVWAVMGVCPELKVSEGVVFQRLAGVQFYENRHIITMSLDKHKVRSNFNHMKFDKQMHNKRNRNLQ